MWREECTADGEYLDNDVARMCALFYYLLFSTSYAVFPPRAQRAACHICVDVTLKNKLLFHLYSAILYYYYLLIQCAVFHICGLLEHFKEKSHELCVSADYVALPHSYCQMNKALEGIERGIMSLWVITYRRNLMTLSRNDSSVGEDRMYFFSETDQNFSLAVKSKDNG